MAVAVGETISLALFFWPTVGRNFMSSRIFEFVGTDLDTGFEQHMSEAFAYRHADE